MVIFLGSSGVAWIKTGTCRSARRNVSAMARSSPKFGRVTMIPSIRSRFFLNNSAQHRDSSRVSTAPCLLSSGVSATTSIPADSRARIISSRPLFARWSGKKPRFPTITPIVIFLAGIKPLKIDKRASVKLSCPPRAENQAIDESDHKQDCSPPHVGMQVEQYNARIFRRIHKLINSGAKNQRTIHQKRKTDKKPNRNHVSSLRLPEDDVQDYENHDYHTRPKDWFLVERNISHGRYRR